jgi:hypothetical protein
VILVAIKYATHYATHYATPYATFCTYRWATQGGGGVAKCFSTWIRKQHLSAPVTMDVISISAAIASNFICRIVRPPKQTNLSGLAHHRPHAIYHSRVVSVRVLEDMRVSD